jgi:hypothetical protein
MAYATIDTLIEQLAALKASGVAGDTAVAFPSLDNNGKRNYALRVESVGLVSAAKTDVEKGFNLYRLVSVRGVPIVMLHGS